MTCVPAPRNGLLHEGGVVLKVHSGHRYRPHRTVRLRLNREQTYASGIPFCSAYCPERTHKYTFYPIKMQEIPTKTSFMDNYSFAAPCRQPPPFACLPSCLLLPPSTFRLPSAACRLPSASTHAPLLYAAPPLRTSPSIRAATNFPSRPRQTSLPGCDGQKKCDPKVALESFQISVKQIFTNSISIPPR